MSATSSDGFPDQIGSVLFQPMPLEDSHAGGGPIQPARFQATLPGRYPGLAHSEPFAVRLLIQFTGEGYPFEKHYLYAQHRDAARPYTFANFDFTPFAGPERRDQARRDASGTVARLAGRSRFSTDRTDHRRYHGAGHAHPWGDELARRAIRGVATIPVIAHGRVTCMTADSRLVPGRVDLYACRLPNAHPLPTRLLPALTGNHPRLMVNTQDIPSLRQRARGSHLEQWNRIIQLLEAPSPPWETTSESKALPGPERLRWDDRALISALVALVDPTPHHVDLARAAMREFVRESQRPDFEPLQIDTQAGETLFILSLAYDWTHGQWLSEEQQSLKEWLWKVADICWAHLGYERHDYAQAHYLGCAVGLLAFSLLFWEEHPRAQEWVAHFRGVLKSVLEMLPTDGFFPHGINLWIYEYGFLLRWMELFRTCTDNDAWHPAEHWRAASLFRSAATTPDGLYGLTFGDPQYRVGGDSWCHYLIAARTGSSTAQWLGDWLVDGAVAGVDFRSVPPRRRVYEFLFYDPDVQAADPDLDSAVSVRFFSDGGQLFVRSRGENPSLFTFRSGPPLGMQRYSQGEQGGYGHSDPCNGSFLLQVNGRFAVSGPGPTYRRDTSMHNTLTVDGQGQVGDSAVWAPDFLPPEKLCSIPRVRQLPSGISVSADLAPGYLPHLGVEKCRRALFIRPGQFIIGVDDICCIGQHKLQWNLHTSSVPVPAGDGRTGVYVLEKEGSVPPPLRLLLLAPEQGDNEIGLAEMVPAYPNDGTRMGYLRVTVEGPLARFIWCILIHPTAHSPRLDQDSAKEAGGMEEVALQCGGDLRISLQDGMLLPEVHA